MSKKKTAILFIAITAGAVNLAHAETAEARFDAYFYSKPRYNAKVLDEVQVKARLEVMSCQGEWCRVRYNATEGYVRELIVRGPEIDLAHKSTRQITNCFAASQPGGTSWQTEQFCY